MRPTRLKNFIGQEHVVEQIQMMLKKKNFPSSILISGPTGCGKTTLAYLISRYLNCEKGTSCGKCNSCKMMRSILSGGSHPDVTHIDAGTRGRIEDVRNLIGITATMPLTARCGVKKNHTPKTMRTATSESFALLVMVILPKNG